MLTGNFEKQKTIFSQICCSYNWNAANDCYEAQTTCNKIILYLIGGIWWCWSGSIVKTRISDLIIFVARILFFRHFTWIIFSLIIVWLCHYLISSQVSFFSKLLRFLQAEKPTALQYPLLSRGTHAKCQNEMHFTLKRNGQLLDETVQRQIKSKQLKPGQRIPLNWMKHCLFTFWTDSKASKSKLI